jgi:cytohesin
VVETLLEHKADVNGSFRGYTALMSTEDPQLARVLLDAGATIDAVNDEGRTALMIKSYNVDMLAFLLDSGADPNRADDFGLTALMLVEDPHAASLLVEAGGDIDAIDSHRMTPLAHAYVNGHTLVLRKLIEMGADVNIADVDGMTMLMRVLEVKTARLLLAAGAQVNLVDGDGVSALLHACRRGASAMIELLLEHKADVNLAELSTSFTPIMHLTWDPDSTRTLLRADPPPRLDVRTADGDTVLSLAVESNDLTVAKMLLEAGASVKVAEENGLFSVLMHGKPDRSFVELALEHGANVFLQDYRGRTPLMHVCGVYEHDEDDEDYEDFEEDEDQDDESVDAECVYLIDLLMKHASRTIEPSTKIE